MTAWTNLNRVLVIGMTAIVCASPVRACIWSYGTDLRGKKVQVEGVVGADLVVQLMNHEARSYWLRENRTYAARAAGVKDHEIRNDYAVTLLHIGKAGEAIQILRRLETEAPGTYVTAVNLGTAYELNGDDVQGLRWIREGIRRNREAHNGSEWLHVRILEAKIALASDPQWLQGNSVLGLDFGRGVVPRMPSSWPKDNSGKPATPQNVIDALYYQLNERLEFVKPPNALIGDLFMDWGNLMMLTDVLESAEALYLQALAFGATSQPLIQQRLTKVQRLLKVYRQQAK